MRNCNILNDFLPNELLVQVAPVPFPSLHFIYFDIFLGFLIIEWNKLSNGTQDHMTGVELRREAEHELVLW